MNIGQTAAVLAKVQLVDNRAAEDQELLLREWHDIIGDLDFEDAIAAVREHRRTSTEYLQPAHLVAIVRSWHDEVAELNRVTYEQKRAWLAPLGITVEAFDADAAARGVTAAIASVEARRAVEAGL